MRDIKNICNLKITFEGPESGVGARFYFDGAGAKGSHTVLSVVPGEMVTAENDAGKLRGKSLAVYKFTEDARGTKVEWNTHMNFGYNPMGRIAGKFLEGKLGPIFERGLLNVKQAVEA